MMVGSDCGCAIEIFIIIIICERIVFNGIITYYVNLVEAKLADDDEP